MTSGEQPTPGDERIVLIPPKRRGGKHVLKRMVWTARGFTTFYDDDALDWVQWHGSWSEAEILGRFDSRDDARAFMLGRAEPLAP